MAAKNRLVQILEKSGSDKKERIELLESTIARTEEKVAADESEYKAEFEKLQETIKEKDSKVKELEDTIGDLSQVQYNNSLNDEDVLGGLSATSQVSLTPAGQRTLSSMNGTYSLTELHSQSNELKRELVKEKRARTKAENELKTIFQELTRRMPLLESYKAKCIELQSKESQVSIIIDSLNKEKSMIKTKLEVTTKKGDELYSQIRKLNQYKRRERVLEEIGWLS
ncbi:unnamed protein product [Ambrosiozyma monospora]|uniref:Unnamed protein product n=1 Tax=Ambrosiozyma monospora TaxID=43982 RepID=A0ACB5TTM7_AMBMO|nr:unnamed protein product [Ambrosiozyma monospora]